MRFFFRQKQATTCNLLQWCLLPHIRDCVCLFLVHIELAETLVCGGINFLQGKKLPDGLRKTSPNHWGTIRIHWFLQIHPKFECLFDFLYQRQEFINRDGNSCGRSGILETMIQSLLILKWRRAIINSVITGAKTGHHSSSQDAAGARNHQARTYSFS